MTHLRRIQPFCWIALSCFVAVACDEANDQDPSFQFSDDEVSVILSQLGTLPEAPPPDLSNAYADDPDAAALGQQLFYDPRYSGNGEISCATCHESNVGFSDARANTSLGIDYTGRASIGLYNGAYGRGDEDATIVWQLWDGRSDSQWSQALGPPESDVVMGGTRVAVALLIYDEYREAYESIFGPLPELRDAQGEPLVDPSLKPGLEEWDALETDLQTDITRAYVNFGKAIGAYERLIVSRNSRFDAFWRALEQGIQSDDLTDQEKAGLRVFIGEGQCIACHNGPNLTDNQFHNLAVSQTGDHLPEADDGRASGVERLLASPFNCAGEWSDHPNKRSCAVNELTRDNASAVGAFKTPTLRGVSESPPYMHTGTLDTLEAVIAHYNDGGDSSGFSGTPDALMSPLGLDDQQQADLAAFLRALDGEPLDARLLGE